jgi:hypothetical protein
MAGVPIGHRALRVGIDQNHRVATVGERAGEVDGDRALAGAALEIADRDDVTHARSLLTDGTEASSEGRPRSARRAVRRRDRLAPVASDVLQTPEQTLSAQG